MVAGLGFWVWQSGLVVAESVVSFDCGVIVCFFGLEFTNSEGRGLS